MKIGNLTLNGVAALAPMAGATDRPFRELCCSFGAAYCVTEMVSTRALQYNYKKNAGAHHAWRKGTSRRHPDVR